MPDRLRSALRKRAWSHRQFAREANVTVQSVTNWLSGKPISVDNLARIAGVLDISIDELIGWTRPAADVETERARQHLRDEATALIAEFAALAAAFEPVKPAVPQLLEVLSRAQRVARELEM